eukprot:gene7965-8609_t
MKSTSGMVFDYQELTSSMRFISEDEMRQNAELLISLSRHRGDFNPPPPTESKMLPSSPAPLTDSGDDGSITSTDTSRVSLPENAPSKYSNFLALAFNEGDANAILHFARNLCIPEIEFVLHVYNIKNQMKGIKKPLNHFGNFTHGVLSLKDVYQFYSNFLKVVPDGYMEILSSRCCYDRECSLYISSFRYTGSITSRNTLIAESDSHGNICAIHDINPAVLIPDCIDFTIEGSFIMYRNKDGKFYKIEWYYEFF